ncbi:NAD(P)H-dependent glycerol-3-phosphate dehydrogenase [Dongia soli]|uniref:Glycerol-3-phosphate dehydrogenase [NAD(P)+] n=1 Tax=Dongia soli TaxID=600628 RepID=A0ABU5E722_9PROT|nr:NAD(P)H-dependent glycerol-3-phosphate dehydrogenase [Dongia soli]MDY0882090.1 NAD(P)H-dependent glycerol-3-phosphate dehydrogenase [Dongia soli]
MTDIKSLSVIGAGAWGTALALIAARAGRDTQLWVRRPEQAEVMRRDGANKRYLPGVGLPPDLRIAGDLPDAFSAALSADAVLYAQPSQYFRAFCRAARPYLAPTSPLVICAKGIELGSGRLMTEIAAEELPGQCIAVLSGPSFAAEAARGLPTAVAIAAAEDTVAQRLMAALSHAAFRPYGASDLVGVEVAGATKNVLAIACGMVIGRGLGENARAALITRGLAEVSRLALAKGGRSETLMGLAGFGDLILTCCSLKSRNTSLGHELGEGRKVADILAQRHTVAEGVTTAAAVVALAEQLQVDMPLCRAVDDILSGRINIDTAVQTLLARPLKREF